MNYPQILEDLKQAMLSKEELKVSTLRMLKAELMKIEKEKMGTEITEEIIQSIVQKMIKQRKDSMEQFQKGGRPELAAKEEGEIKILQSYLPEQMSEEDIRAAVTSTKAELGITGKEGIGKLMGALMGKLKGKADGVLIKKIAEEELAS